MVKKKPQTLQELFQKAAKRSTPDDQEEKELQKALELSQKEHVNEQRRLLAQFFQVSQPTTEEDDQSEHIKQEEKEPLLEIADLSAFLNASDTEEEIVDNLSEFLPPTSSILIDDDDVPFAKERLDWQGDATVISDSDCSVIDLVDPDNSSKPNDDDGYLSPLEGFTNIKENREDAQFNPFFQQLEQKTTKRKRTTKKKKPAYRSKWYFVNKRKRKKN
ncbi:hypothetical protein EDC96DRAFT_572309 [Choanephora cucurbitarum]|nr:hypothetical protein EDC96DRAFT_572309 [Choanephora cucurbitarum]